MTRPTNARAAEASAEHLLRTVLGATPIKETTDAKPDHEQQPQD